MPTPDDVLHQRDVTADCGCGPTEDEKRALFGSMSRRTAFGVAAMGVVGAAVLGGTTLSASPAHADGYPSWDDVQKAKDNQAAKSAEISRIEGLISQLQADVARTQAASEAAGQAYFDAQQAYALAASRADLLQSQADTESAAADEAAKKAAQVAAQLYRNGGDDTALQLFFSDSAASADEMLSRLGQMDKLLEHNKSIYDSAVTARNNAKSLSAQAAVQRTERDRLQKEAQQKWEAAQAAAQAAQSALDAQNQNLDTLQAQLAALKDTTNKVVADYQKGVEEARKAAEAARAAAEAEARRLAEQAAQDNSNSGVTTPGGAVTSSGWSRPSSGWETSGYGPRYAECGNGYCASSFHEGVDLASGCGSAIYAAQSGTVVYAGYNGGYGNYIRIDHGGGIATGYGHIQYGGILVGYGQWVNSGQVIALEGNTGNSFGCHVHFEVYVWGSTTNPVPFMAARGISV